MKFDKSSGNTIKRFLNKKADFQDWICKRLEGTFIENEDAISVIKRFDSPEALIFCDPPYLTDE